MIIQHNASAMNANRQLGISLGGLQKSAEKLSSGYRINRAGDDAAGLAISEKMRGQIRGLNQASTNSQDGISLIQTAEGALNETHSILQRMRELAVQASSDTNTDDDKKQIQSEISQLTQEIDRIANTTEFNTMKLLDGSRTGAVNYEKGSGKIETNFANGKLDAVKLTNVSNIACDDVIRIEITKDVSAGSTVLSDEHFKMTNLKGTAGLNIVVSAAGGKVILSVGTAGNTAAGIFDAAKKANDGFSEDEVEVLDLSKVLTGLKAGDTITITLNSVQVSKGAEAGKEAVNLQIGANAGQEMSLGISAMKAENLSIVDKNGNALKVTDQKHASLAINAFDTALQKVSSARSKMGAVQNRLEHTISNLDTAAENLQISESRIRDVNMAKEMTNYSKNNILLQAGQSMLAQANQQTQGVLSLLR